MTTLDTLRSLGRLLLTAGLTLAAVGLVLVVLSKFGLSGRLPGDILIQKKNFTLFFPVVSMLLLSVVLSVVLSFFLRR
jgi:hypothetical protein